MHEPLSLATPRKRGEGNARQQWQCQDVCHFYDLIYPLFLLLIGTVLPFSLNRRQAQGEEPGWLCLHFLKRSVVLIVLGSIPGGLLNFTKWPYLGGVLAHIGLCYLPAAILVRHTGWRTRGVVVVSWLLGYWLACLLIPVPGFGAGVFTREGSLPSYIDHLFNFKDIARLFVGGIEHHAGAFAPLVLPLGVLALKWWLLWFLYQRKAFFKL
jgi:predicted acyltransferase